MEKFRTVPNFYECGSQSAEWKEVGTSVTNRIPLTKLPQRLEVQTVIAKLLFHRPLSKIGIILHRVVYLLIAPVLYIVTWNNERLANLGFSLEE